MNAMMAISQWAAELPGGWQYVRSPQEWMMVGWYCLLFGLGTGWAWRSVSRSWMFLGGGIFVGLLFLAWQKDRSAVRMTFLPQGPVVHVEEEGPLVDCGDERVAEMVVPRQLRVRGGGCAGSLCGQSFGDASCRGIACVEGIVFASGDLSNPGAAVHLRLGNRSGGLLLRAGDQVGNWDVIHPAQGEDFPRSTDDALVLRGEFHGVTVLLLSDLGYDGRQALMRRNAGLQAEVLALSIPDRSGLLDLGFLNVVKPKVIVVQDCLFPVTERASASWLARSRETGAIVLSVRELGGIRLTIEPAGWRLENAEGVLFFNDASPGPDNRGRSREERRRRGWLNLRIW